MKLQQLRRKIKRLYDKVDDDMNNQAREQGHVDLVLKARKQVLFEVLVLIDNAEAEDGWQI